MRQSRECSGHERECYTGALGVYGYAGGRDRAELAKVKGNSSSLQASLGLGGRLGPMRRKGSAVVCREGEGADREQAVVSASRLGGCAWMRRRAGTACWGAPFDACRCPFHPPCAQAGQACHSQQAAKTPNELMESTKALMEA